jgi:predicted nucleotidyltransferase
LDIAGWDIKKALSLYRKTNAALFEWLQSPIIYSRDISFHNELLCLMDNYYAPRLASNHYISMALHTYKNDLQAEEVKLKKYFYALRPLLAAKWIIDRQTIPPMEFGKLRAIIGDDKVQNAIDELLDTKKAAVEKAFIKSDALLQRFIGETLDYCNTRKDSLRQVQPDTEPLNRFFRKTIGLSES